jgi:hypothetical protein
MQRARTGATLRERVGPIKRPTDRTVGARTGPPRPPPAVIRCGLSVLPSRERPAGADGTVGQRGEVT